MLYSVRNKYSLVYPIICIILLLIISGCGSSDSTSTDGEVSNDTFAVQVSPASISLAAGQEIELTYVVTNSDGITVVASINTQPDLGEVTIDEGAQAILFSAGDEVGSGQFEIVFSSNNISESIAVSYQITATDSSEDDNDGGNEGDGGEGDGEVDTTDYKITWPTDYITLFEDEVVTININRNYELNGDVLENFYLNAANLNGQLSQDNSQYLISADPAEEDTYGELLAVSEIDGVVNEQPIQIIYYNKNRDLETVEPPVIALIEPVIELNLYQSSTINFDIYDPDSDRISYRVISAPSAVTTHVNKALYGYELTVSLNQNLESDSETVTLEVSDGHLTDQIDILLTQSNTTADENDVPVLSIEENVTLSLIKKLTGLESDKVAQFAYVLTDNNKEFVDLTFSSTTDDFTITNNPPYFSVFSDDVSELQYEQVTISANDAGYESKLTFHLYIKDNFTSFLGGNPNLAPLIEVPLLSPLLESKTMSFDVVIEDFEDHPYSIAVVADESILTSEISGDQVTITATLLAQPDDLNTEFDIVVTDVFGSERVETVSLTIYKNTPPAITADATALDIVETGQVQVAVSVEDVDEGSLEPQLIYDSSKMTAEYSDGLLTIEAFDLDELFTDNFIIRAVDEFGAVSELELPLIIRTDNSAPQITLSQSTIEIAPGQSESLLVNYFDPDGTELEITRYTNNSLLTESYDQNTGLLTLSLDASATFQQTMTLVTTASDGFITVSETITVIVPIAPSPPELTINAFVPEVDEDETLIINFITDDQNGDNVIVSVQDGGTSNFLSLNVTVYDNYLQIVVPDNVTSITNYAIEVIATDDSTSNLSVSETIQFNVMPVNDPPTLGLVSNNIELTNDYITRINLNISDVDNDAADFTVELLADNGNAIPNTLEIAGLDVNSLQLKAAYKGISMVNQPLKLRVFDGQTYTEETLLVTALLQNNAPVFGDSIDSAQVLEDYTDQFDIQITDEDTPTDGDVASIKEINIGNVSGANPVSTTVVDGITVNTQIGVGVSVTQIEQFVSNNRIHIATAAGSGGSTVLLSVIATDGFVDIAHDIRLKIVAP